MVCQLCIIVGEMAIKINEIDKNVGMNIRLLRVKRGISQEKLAEIADVSSTTMGCIERGEKSSTVQTLAKVANALDVDIRKFFTFDD